MKVAAFPSIVFLLCSLKFRQTLLFSLYSLSSFSQNQTLQLSKLLATTNNCSITFLMFLTFNLILITVLIGSVASNSYLAVDFDSYFHPVDSEYEEKYWDEKANNEDFGKGEMGDSDIGFLPLLGYKENEDDDDEKGHEFVPRLVYVEYKEETKKYEEEEEEDDFDKIIEEFIARNKKKWKEELLKRGSL